MSVIISINKVNKTFSNGEQAVKDFSLDILSGEIIALLGPNGAGKTTLISMICGIVSPTSGSVIVNGFDVVRDYRKTRKNIGLVPQELHLESFETVFNSVKFSRGLFGYKRNDFFIEKILKQLTLWDKRNTKIMELSGGMKRRVLIAKALSHEPNILFLDEPSAGVDVELRKEMWGIIKDLKKEGVTIILTTHYIEEAEEMADRVGIINNGELLLVEEKKDLLSKMGSKTLTIELTSKIKSIPKSLSSYDLKLLDTGNVIIYNYKRTEEKTGITSLLLDLKKAGLQLSDLNTKQTSLEEIFVDMVKN
ncbi:MAG: ABC transporter ATP-binding protein [Candidatus Puniceispirillales bacterium]|tara:strand:- start:1513 stop:2433 length:921 start_codon:yes stop_codon:yes gene_type:complete